MSRSARRRVQDMSEAREMLADLASSGQSLPEWCASEGIDGRSLAAWKARLSPPPLRLVEVGVRPATPAPAAPPVYRVVVGALRLEVGDDFREETLARLVRLARSC